jgi:hypothetical protein
MAAVSGVIVTATRNIDILINYTDAKMREEFDRIRDKAMNEFKNSPTYVLSATQRLFERSTREERTAFMKIWKANLKIDDD